ncbi:MAG: fasciclin domain-containing protein [Propionibacteriaceae bacterium]
MSTAGVATAASNNPLLSTLVTAVKKAGLVDTLNTTQNITVFAPDNTAFAAVNKTDLTKLLANKSQLTKTLTTHVVKGRLAPDQLAGTHKTLSGSTITITGSGTDFTVNGNAHVVCGNVQTANATVYIIDHVLSPS